VIDELLEIGTMPDWVSPILAGLQDVINGPSHTLTYNCGWSGKEIADLHHGIET